MALANPLTDVQGFIARDDHRREIVVSLRGSASIVDALLDAQVVQVPFVSPGVRLPGGVRVHSGFLIAWDSLAVQVIKLVGWQLERHEGYTIVTTGHSLGGSIALLCAVTLQQNYKDSPIRTYSYGAPRTGNKILSDYVNATFGENAYRVVHGDDGVPTMIPRQLGYHHHGIEYWQYTHPASEDTTSKCDPEGEDPACSASIKPSRGVTLAHMSYFGIMSTTPFCF
ncbi:alpha/beta-hydrolase [Agrocybe pediades]|nr:alpha/beta-hydrolase [Agrocybe pediades]